MSHAPLVGLDRFLVTAAVAGAVFMQGLDAAIANVAIPAISGDLGVSSSQGTWVITSFTVANAIALPLTGWLARRFGEVRLFAICVLMFTLASWGCGLALNIETLILCRILQGAFCGPLIPMSQTLMLAVFPAEKRGTALAIWSTMALIGPVVGPVVGGLLTDNISWPWIFFINVPAGLLCVWLFWPRMRARESTIVKQPVDTVGLVLLVIGVGSLQILLDQGRELDWFNATPIVVLAVIAAIALIALVIWELTEAHPIVDLHLFGQRNFAVGTFVASLTFMIYFASIVILPLFLQTQLGYTATWAGLATAPTSILSIALMPVVGKYLYKVDARYFAMTSCLVFAFCFFWRANFNPEVDLRYILVPQVLQGMGTAFMFIPMTAVVFAGLKPERLASAAGLSNFVRVLGNGFGASLAMTLWDRRAVVHHANLSENVSPYNPVWLDHMESWPGDLETGFAQIEAVITNQAHILGAVELFWLSAWIFLALIPLVWITRPLNTPKAKAAAAPAPALE